MGPLDRLLAPITERARPWCSWLSWVRRCGLGASLLGFVLAVWAWTANVAARERVQVILWRPSIADSFVDEVVVRTLGELNALGFRSQTTTEAPEPWPPSNTHTAVLRLRRAQDEIVVDAWCPDCTLPLSQTMPAFAANSTAEVVAVRAVDVLRAAMLEFSERTRTEPPTEWALPPPATTSTNTRNPETQEPSPLNPAPWKLEVSLGANWLRELGRPGSELALASGVGMQWETFGVGLRVNLPAASQAIEAAPGSVEPQRWRALGYLQALVQLGDDWWAGLQVGAGATWYRLSPTPVVGFAARQQNHTSPVLASHVGLRHWFLPNVGAHLTVGVAVATDAPIIVMAEREVTRLDAPTLETGAGLLLRLP